MGTEERAPVRLTTGAVNRAKGKPGTSRGAGGMFRFLRMVITETLWQIGR
jgi:hypothetical protein